MTTLHASAVAVDGRGLLILGPSGAGKSALALRLMAVGARLVADDRVVLTSDGAGLVASCPAALAGRIEARGIGILNATALTAVPVALVVDLGQVEHDRLPPRRTVTIRGVTLPLVLGPVTAHLPAALRQMLLAGRSD